MSERQATIAKSELWMGHNKPYRMSPIGPKQKRLRFCKYQGLTFSEDNSAQKVYDIIEWCGIFPVDNKCAIMDVSPLWPVG